MDKDGYPIEEELEKIRTWDIVDFLGMMKFIKCIWKYPERGWHESLVPCEFGKDTQQVYEISTSGWSGNEEIIEAIHNNHMMWILHCYQSTRGGQYIFKPYRLGEEKGRQ